MREDNRDPAKKTSEKVQREESVRRGVAFRRLAGRLIPLWVLFVTVLMAFAFGALLDRVLLSPRNSKQEDTVGKELRAPTGRLTSPLLDCEVYADQGQRTLQPFKYKVEELLQQYIDKGLLHDGSVYFRELNNGMWFGINEEVFYRPASMLKVPVMIAYYKLAESNPAILGKQILFRGNDDLSRIQGVPPSTGLAPGKSYPVEELIYYMIVDSDNNSAQLLVENIDPRFLDKVMADLDVNYNQDNLERMITTHSYAGFFRVLFNASYLNRDFSERALHLLSQSKFNDGIRAGLPPGIVAATKFGEWGDTADSEIVQLHEFGIVYYPEHPYLLGIMTRGKRGKNFEALIKDISQTVFTSVTQEENRKYPVHPLK